MSHWPQQLLAKAGFASADQVRSAILSQSSSVKRLSARKPSAFSKVELTPYARMLVTAGGARRLKLTDFFETADRSDARRVGRFLL